MLYKDKIGWILLGLCLLATYFAQPNQELVLIFFSLSFICCLLCFWKPEVPIFKLLLASYLVRLLMLYIRTSPWFIDWSNIILGDEIGYEAGAAKYAQLLHAGIFPEIFRNIKDNTYHILISVPYALLGRIPNLIRLCNVMISTLTVYFIYLITEIFFGKKAAKMAGWIYCFWPSTLFSVISMCRDALALLTILVFIWSSLNLWQKKNLSWLIILVLDGILLFLLRFSTLFVTLLIFSGPLICYLTNKNIPPLRRVFLAVALGAIIAFGGLLVVKYMARGLTYEDLMKERRDWGGSAYLRGILLDSPWAVIKYAFLGGLHFFFGPFLWELRTQTLVASFLGSSVPIILLFILSFRPWQQLTKDQPASAWGILLFFIVSCLGFGLFEGNYGAALRHREQFVWLLVVMASPNLQKLWDSKIKSISHQSKQESF